ncbi:hypothetical protein B0H67DRAFT_482530 [Lasiosphaeris hirsuta]|uniref:N-acetylgalactosaminide beta-1,3-galactosyltransferase n=1 Tax=Lasiosphaeris hirsuta TaxID=260670 RepID=A0AA40AZ07_9PEZI|nr:hypothetical protein B0H67DRAFT_482530 [Lasiosphaeris hirsuta]
MLSRRSLFVLALAVASILALLVTSRRLGAWTAFDGTYYHPDPHRSHHAPQGTHDNPGLEPLGGPGANGSHNADLGPPARPCSGFPNTDNILLVMKTGASESFARIPTQLVTTLSCLPDYLIFSDMAQDIGGQRIFDSLDKVSASVQENNADFDLYRRQKACIVDQDGCNKLGDPANEGWALDKYKNVHIAEKTYAMRPGYDWYVFVDADTYVLWPNMVQWLSGLKASKKHYLGSVTLINDFSFGHGGSGYVVSQAAMKSFVGKNKGVGNAYDLRAKNECCGDYVFAMALKELSKVSIEQVWPTINGEKPATLPFGPSHWCHPIVTMHHMNSEEINTFWNFERDFRRAQGHGSAQQPLLIKDIYHHYFESKLQARRDDWDNHSDDRFYLETNSTYEWEDWQVERVRDQNSYNEFQAKAHLSFEACEAACQSLDDHECFQFQYRDGACSTSKSFQLGKPVKNDGNDSHRTSSGWDVKKIQKFATEHAKCPTIHWPNVPGG